MRGSGLSVSSVANNGRLRGLDFCLGHCSPLPDKTLRLHAQGIGKPRYVVEIPDHLRGVVNRHIVESRAAQRIEIVGAGEMLIVRELRCETTQRQIGVSEGRGAPIAHHSVYQVVGTFGG